MKTRWIYLIKQFHVNLKRRELNLQLYLRSSDFFLANNWNTITGAFLVHMICNLKDVDLTPGDLTVITGDTHIYKNHIGAVKTNIKRIYLSIPSINKLKLIIIFNPYMYEFLNYFYQINT